MINEMSSMQHDDDDSQCSDYSINSSDADDFDQRHDDQPQPPWSPAAAVATNIRHRPSSQRHHQQQQSAPGPLAPPAPPVPQPTPQEKRAKALEAATARLLSQPPLAPAPASDAAAGGGEPTASGIAQVGSAAAGASCCTLHAGHELADCAEVLAARKRMVRLLHTKVIDRNTEPAAAYHCICSLRALFHNAHAAAAALKAEGHLGSVDLTHPALTHPGDHEHVRHLRVRADNAAFKRNVLEVLPNTDTGEHLLQAAGWHTRVVEHIKYFVFDPWVGCARKHPQCVACWTVAMEALRACELQLAKVELGAKERASGIQAGHLAAKALRDRQRDAVLRQVDLDKAERRKRFTYT